ncbi:MAG: hypothetical protein LBT09_08835 [Planctomycetaceae bacterium]|nr:hypothetical protein [Planctomycetaceae bacterium]
MKVVFYFSPRITNGAFQCRKKLFNHLIRWYCVTKTQLFYSHHYNATPTATLGLPLHGKEKILNLIRMERYAIRSPNGSHTLYAATRRWV